MGSFRSLAIIAAVSAASTAGALAADIPGDLLTAPLPAYERPSQNVEYSSGWYLRGDIGYRFQSIGASSSANTAQVPALSAGKLNNTFSGGLGAGIKQDWLRLDLTGDYGWRAKYEGTRAGGTIAGKVDSFAVMGNAYVDFGTWYGLTPYAGAGLGGANLIFSGYQNAGAIAPMPSTAASVNRWNFAWAAMAGVSYTVTRGVLLDIGYRHIDMGDISGGPTGSLSVKKLTDDEVRVGFRYLID